MELSMHTRQQISERTHKRYQAATKSEKRQILDEYIQLTGYTRKYASWILTHWGRNVSVVIKGHLIQYEAGKRAVRKKSGRPTVYGQSFNRTLKDLWYLFDCLCGKRFVPMIHALLDVLISSEVLECSEQDRLLLGSVSPATVDRLLSSERRALFPHGRSITRPGSLLKRQIPVRTFADWSDLALGFIEADLVAHDGGSPYGDFLCTLTMTDVATGWTEPICVMNKAQKHVFAGLKAIRARLPFPVLGLDTDNGSEFVNHHLVRYCATEKITFTRSRPYRKNDNCFVEQKNNSVVRRSVGYMRFSSEDALVAMNELYAHLRLLVNFVYPSAKLITKTRIGSRVIRKHDQPATPYQRIMARDDVAPSVKEALAVQYHDLDPIALARQFKLLQDGLLAHAAPVTNPFKPYKVFHAATLSRQTSS
jgi:hypothetical protein